MNVTMTGGKRKVGFDEFLISPPSPQTFLRVSKKCPLVHIEETKVLDLSSEARTGNGHCVKSSAKTASVEKGGSGSNYWLTR